jgi:hypothetical protein
MTPHRKALAVIRHENNTFENLPVLKKYISLFEKMYGKDQMLRKEYFKLKNRLWMKNHAPLANTGVETETTAQHQRNA